MKRMKTIFTLFLFLCPGLGSLVIDLPQNDQKTLLTFDNDIRITSINSFCIRFRLTGLQGYRTLFCTHEFEYYKYCLLFEVIQKYGFVYLNEESFIFTIRRDLVQPYAWHNFCFSFDGKSYKVVVEGQIWHQGNRQSCSRMN